MLVDEDKINEKRAESALILDIERKTEVSKLDAELRNFDWEKYKHPSLRAAELLAIDDNIECVEEFTTEQLRDLVLRKEDPEEEIDINPVKEVISYSTAVEYLEQISIFFEQKGITVVLVIT